MVEPVETSSFLDWRELCAGSSKLPRERKARVISKGPGVTVISVALPAPQGPGTGRGGEGTELARGRERSCLYWDDGGPILLKWKTPS